MLEGGGKAVALFRIVSKPVEELGEAPLVRVNTTAPLDGFDVFFVCEFGDLLRFFLGAVIAPEVVVVERFEVFANRNDAGAGGIERNRFDLRAVDTGFGDGFACRFDERVHLVLVGLRGVVGVIAFALERVFGGCSAEPASFAVEQGDAYAECTKIYAGYDGHPASSLMG